MTGGRAWLSVAAVLLLAGCEQTTKDELNALPGFGGLDFGISFEEAMTTAASPLDFNAASIADCLSELPLKGCFLSPANELTTFRRIDGIPFALQLEFNRLGALTDITLKFVRRRTYDSDLDAVPASITEAECKDVIERTVDWISRDYGRFDDRIPKAKSNAEAVTSKGNRYWLDRSTDGTGFIISGQKKMAEGREITLFGHFFMFDGDPDCDLSVGFNDAPSVERHKL